MKWTCLVALLATALALIAAAPGARADDGRIFTGNFDAKGSDGQLAATFWPDGDQRWKAVFDFVFQGHADSYAGTVEGSLTAGELRGRVQDPNANRTFTFRGRCEDGVFHGTHAEIEGGREVPTGSLTLAAATAGDRTLTGDYTSGYGNGPLEAVFTPDGDGRWRVAFHFVFSGSERTYSGSAEGSLGQGELRGRVSTPSGSRTFTFRGEFENRRFHGTHAEVHDGREHRTGTLTLEG